MAIGKSKRERLASTLEGTGALGLLQRAQRRLPARKLVVLTYHRLAKRRIDDGPFLTGCINATEQSFRRQLALLSRFHNVVSLQQVVAAFCDGEDLPPAPVLITFDDGYRSCFDIALPVLREYGMSAAFFIPTRFVDRREVYGWDRISYLLHQTVREELVMDYPRPLRLSLANRPAAIDALTALFERWIELDHTRFFTELEARLGVRWDGELEHRCAEELVMTWDQVRALHRAGMAVESHTRSHRVLQTVPLSELPDELRGAREDLRRHVGVDSTTLAYPAGYPIGSDVELRRSVRDAGYRLGFTFGGGQNPLAPALDPLDVHRSPVNSYHSEAMFRMQLAIPGLAYRSPRAAAFTPISAE